MERRTWGHYYIMNCRVTPGVQWYGGLVSFVMFHCVNRYIKVMEAGGHLIGVYSAFQLLFTLQ